MARKILRYGQRTFWAAFVVLLLGLGFYSLTQKWFVFDAAHRLNQANLGRMS